MLRQGLFFLLAGALATAAQYAILIVLVHGGTSPLTASSFGAVFGALINYGLNRRYTFRSRRAHRAALPRYLITAAVGFLLNGIVLSAFIAAHQHYLLAQTGATGVVLLWNFFVNRGWTFRGEVYAP